MNSKYQEFWGLTQPLFLSQVSKSDLYITTRWQQVTDHVLAYLETKGETFVLVGPQGCGKSIYLKWLQQRVPATTHQFIMRSPIQTITKPGWFLRSLVSEFPKEAFIKTTNNHSQFQDQVINMMATFLDQSPGYTFIIDHAQAISEDALTEVETFSQAARLANLNINILLVMTKSDRFKERLAISTAKIIDFPVWSEDEFCEYVTQRLQSQNISQMPSKAVLHDIFQTIDGNISRGNFLLEDLLIQAYHQNERSFELEATRVSELATLSTKIEPVGHDQTKPTLKPAPLEHVESHHSKFQELNRKSPQPQADMATPESAKNAAHTESKPRPTPPPIRETAEVAGDFDKPKLKSLEREKLPVKETVGKRAKGAKAGQPDKKEEQANPETLSDLFDN